MDELEEIRKLWVIDKNEIEDTLPDIYKKATGKDFTTISPYHGKISKEDITILKNSIDGEYDNIHYQLIRNLISTELKHSTSSKRTGISNEIEKHVTKGCLRIMRMHYRMLLKRNEGSIKKRKSNPMLSQSN